MPEPPGGLRPEPGSYRDPRTRVFYSGADVLRGLDAQAAQDWKALAATDFFPAAQAAGRLTPTEEVAGPEPGRWAAVLRHERIPFVSYPYEWSYGMLRDAAALHLDLLRDALGAGLTMKDGTAYNVQWRGAVPQFVDIGSFEPARDGEPWAGYRQFCQTMLYPLMLHAHLGVDFQPWLRGRIDGVEPGQIRPLFGGTRRMLPGVLKHVHLHDAMQARNAERSTGTVRDQLRDAGFNRELVLATVRALAKLVDKLDRPPAATQWVDYRETCGYSGEERAAKAAFVEAALRGAATAGLDLVLDLGANDGAYARQAADRGAYVVAVDSDAGVVDRLYRDLSRAGDRRILPLTMDLADPSPGLGWAGAERSSFADRVAGAAGGRAASGGGTDAVLALALVHHLAIGRNVPLPLIVDWLVGHARTVVVEFVHPEDPMAKRLLANKPEGLFPDYRRDAFEQLLGARCEITRREELPGGTRTLYTGARRG
ncbi:MAG TPA: class I SAM-dependent methyltransferase [Asanoa sp.]